MRGKECDAMRVRCGKTERRARMSGTKKYMGGLKRYREEREIDK